MKNNKLVINLFWSGYSNGLSWPELDINTGLDIEVFQETNDRAWRESIRKQAIALGKAIHGMTPDVAFSDECPDCGEVSGYDGSDCLCRQNAKI